MLSRNGPRGAAALVLVVTLATAPTAAATAPESGPAVPDVVQFDRHVEGLLHRLGCNAGSCHGAAEGKGGLKLSLFGADPGHDYEVLMDRGRVDSDAPKESLILRKPTRQVRHGGGRRFETGSWEYRVLHRWIEQGAKRGPAAQVKRLAVNPADLRLEGPGSQSSVRVTAEFADGSREDVTGFSSFRTGNEDVAAVDAFGNLAGRRPGFTTVVAGYAGAWDSGRVLVPRQAGADFAYPAVSEGNLIDRVVLARLSSVRVVPSDLCTDTEFLRRVSIDVTGSLPSPDDVRSFLADSDANKRNKRIDELLGQARHASLWATKFCDWTACDVAALEDPADLRLPRARMWHDWFRRRVQDNVPYDEVVRGVLCGTTRGDQELATWMDEETDRLTEARRRGSDPSYAARPFLDLYWRRAVPPERMAELTAAAFMGIRVQCAQCHRHPFDRWSQADYRAFANAFAPVRFGQSAALRVAVAERLEAQRAGRTSRPLARLQEVYVDAGSGLSLPDPQTGRPATPRALGGPPLAGPDARDALVSWLTAKDNPYFARSFANRVWQHYFGRGLVDPVDDFSDARPPDFPELLDALADEFVKGGYDSRGLERLILNSRTYQLSATPNATNAEDETGFARFRPRRPMAELVADLICDACGVEPHYRGDSPKGIRAAEIVTNQPTNPFLRRVAAAFGRPGRTQLCDCERRNEPVLAESLLLLSDPDILRLAAGGRVARLVRDQTPNAGAVEELYLAALCRPPTAAELEAVLGYITEQRDRRAGLEGILWALLNTREFILVH